MPKKLLNKKIIRRYFRSSCEYALGFGTQDAIEKILILMENNNIKTNDRLVVPAAEAKKIDGEKKEKGKEGVVSAAALQLSNGEWLLV